MHKCLIARFDLDYTDRHAIDRLEKNVPKGVRLSDYIEDHLGVDAWNECVIYTVEAFVQEFNYYGFGDEDVLKAFYVEEGDDKI